MPVTILDRGTEAQRRIVLPEVGLDAEYLTIPFVGVQQPDLSLGFGYFFFPPEEEDPEFTFYEDSQPFFLIQNWRAMKMLDLLPVYDSETLRQCWNCACIDLPLTELKKGERTPWGARDTSALRATALSQYPDAANLCEMLGYLEQLEVSVFAEEIEEAGKKVRKKGDLFGKLLVLHSPPLEPSQNTTFVRQHKSLPHHRVKQ